MPPNRPSNVRVQITRHAYNWFRQSPWWLNHQTKSSKSIKKVITYAHSTQKYSSPHANLTKYLMRHTSHAHSTQPYSISHANLTKYLMRHNTCKVYHQNQFYTPKNRPQNNQLSQSPVALQEIKYSNNYLYWSTNYKFMLTTQVNCACDHYSHCQTDNSA